MSPGMTCPLARLAAAALLAVASLVAACGSGGGGDVDGDGTTPADGPPRDAPGAWVVLGSSTAAGVGAPAGEGWVALLARHAQPWGVTVHNLARAGLLSTQELPVGSAVPAGQPGPDATLNIDAAMAFQPQLVILALPTNDSVAGLSAEQTVAAWTTIAARATAGGAATLVLSTQPRAGLSAPQQATLEATDRLAALAFGSCFVALREALAGPDGAPAAAYSAGDGIHLNAAGHALIERRVAATLTAGDCVSAPAL